jgi:hypothetical protein
MSISTFLTKPRVIHVKFDVLDLTSCQRYHCFPCCLSSCFLYFYPSRLWSTNYSVLVLAYKAENSYGSLFGVNLSGKELLCLKMVDFALKKYQHPLAAGLLLPDATLSHMVKECRKLFSAFLCNKKRDQKSRLIRMCQFF